MNHSFKITFSILAVVGMIFAADWAVSDSRKEWKKIVFVAGKKSHGYMAHEHYAGCKLLAKWLDESGLPLDTVVYKDGWPDDPNAFDGADTIIMYADGGGNHPVRGHLDQVNELTAKGMGVVAIHYGVEIPKGEDGDALKSWIGGYFETHYSVNPHWIAAFGDLPEHPITNGVKPFSINDEWYYNMRFIKGMKGVLPILSDVPPKSTLSRPDGAHSGNPEVRKMLGIPQHVAWAYDRPDGGRGFGFTGGHWHWNWAHPEFRQLVLNAIVWTAHLEVPAVGIETKPVTLELLNENQDYSIPENFNIERVEKLIHTWNER